MITVHHLENSRSQRILWLLEELGLDYTIERYERHPETMLAPEELTDVHPLGRSPVVTDGDSTLAESGAIIESLLDRYGDGRLRPPTGTPERDRYTYWMHYAEGTLMPLLLLKLVFARLSQPPVPGLIRPIGKLLATGFESKFTNPRLKSNLDYLEDELSDGDWFVGDQLTAADIQMSFPLEAGLASGRIPDEYAAIRGFVERVHARPAYQQALEKGGPYAYA